MWKIEIFKEIVGPERTPRSTGEFLNRGKEYPNWQQASEAAIQHLNANGFVNAEYDRRHGCWWGRKKDDDPDNLVLWIRRA